MAGGEMRLKFSCVISNALLLNFWTAINGFSEHP